MSMKPISPYERTTSRQPEAWLLPSLWLAFNDAFVKGNLAGAQRIELLSEENAVGRLTKIGVRQTQNGKSWKLKGNQKSRVRYLNLKKYLTRFDFTVNKKLILPFNYDALERAWVAPFPSLAEIPQPEPREVGTDLSEILDLQEIRRLILEVVPQKDSVFEPLDIPTIRDRIKEKIQVPNRWGWGRRKRAALNRKVRYQVKKLVTERKLTEAAKKGTYRPTGQTIRYFFRV